MTQELAFRSAILYGGLLVSNAFGSVSDPPHFSLLSRSEVLNAHALASILYAGRLRRRFYLQRVSRLKIAHGCGNPLWNGRQEGNPGLALVSLLPSPNGPHP